MTQRSKVITRFAPSPTGFLHIGNVRTALFNWLYARHCGGTFLLRIEDTDRARSTEPAIQAIYDGLSWLGIDWDGDAISQFARADRHREVVDTLLAQGNAYRCYATPEELEEMRETARKEGRSPKYDGRWRDRDASEAPKGVPPVIRLKAPTEGTTTVQDQVQGVVTFANKDLDDMVLLRSDGTPTYMLSVVVDDHDMGVTHIIRGDDHLNNAGRQLQLYNAMDWVAPIMAHAPLIHGSDGKKLSKRHGDLGAEDYRQMGILPEALVNYLLRLGWSHADDEIISLEQAVEWFELSGLNKGASQLDLVKLESINAHYIKQKSDEDLTDWLIQNFDRELTDKELGRIKSLMPALKDRSKVLPDLINGIGFLLASRPIQIEEKAAKPLEKEGARDLLADLYSLLTAMDSWTHDEFDAVIRAFADEKGVGFGKVAQPLRASLTGTTNAPGIYDVLVALGKEEVLLRIKDQMTQK
jgi:glutamyl-tRNA synthetase